MSYDVLMFDPDKAPAEREAFLTWYGEQTQWSEEHDYDDAAVTTPRLAAWFHDFRQSWPALNGPQAGPDDEVIDNPQATDYSIGRSVIYACFGWPAAERAAREVLVTAAKHGIGVYYCSHADGAVWAPTPDAGYACLHRDPHGEGEVRLSFRGVRIIPEH